MLSTSLVLKHHLNTTSFIRCRFFTASTIYFKSKPLSFNPKLHAHPTSANNGKQNYAISYISSQDSSIIERHPELIIGWTTSTEQLDPKTFIENNKFVDFLTKTLKENVHKVKDDNLKTLAEWQNIGWLHVNDERNPPPWGRINNPEDIIGSVELDEGKIKEGSYQPMPAHRIVTTNGIFQLSEPLSECIIDAAKKVASE